jgi:hypothetical protein
VLVAIGFRAANHREWGAAHAGNRFVRRACKPLDVGAKYRKLLFTEFQRMFLRVAGSGQHGSEHLGVPAGQHRRQAPSAYLSS